MIRLLIRQQWLNIYDTAGMVEDLSRRMVSCNVIQNAYHLVVQLLEHVLSKILKDHYTMTGQPNDVIYNLIGGY